MKDWSAQSGRDGNQYDASLIELLLLSSSVAYLLYLIYFAIAPYVWSFNPVPPENLFTVWARIHVADHDGMEVYALYALMFLNIAAATGAVTFFRSIHRPQRRYIVLFILMVLTGVFAFSAGFNPPMSTLVTNTASVLVWQIVVACFGVAILLALLHYLQSHSDKAVAVLIAFLLIPVCFIATQPTSWTDSSYIFSPALRLLHGEKISDIYFQYDLLLSVVAASWMKLKIDVEYFQVLAQATFYLFIMAVFLFSRKLFFDKGLSLFLLISLAIMKMYAMDQEPSSILQVTPLRLDLWLPLLMLVYFKGPRHWACGLYCGILVVVHKNFGIIYGAAYFQLVLTVLLTDYPATCGSGRLSPRNVWAFLRSELPGYRYSALLLMAGIVANRLLCGGVNAANAGLYRKIGIGFIKISPHSFYWYPFVLAGLAFAFLFTSRDRIDRRYLTTGYMLVFLAIGNSVYFFGRSHENNIINISGTLLLLFFFTLDMIGRYDVSTALSPVWRNYSLKLSAVACIAVISVYYGNKIFSVVELQWDNAKIGQNIYPAEFRKEYFLGNLDTARDVTRNSRKVYFLTFNDFKYCYFGGYAPVGYFSPFQSWLIQKDLTFFLSELVRNGYYLVIEETRFSEEILPLIGCNKTVTKNGLLFMWKE